MQRENLKILVASLMIIVVLALVIGEFLGYGTIRAAHVNAILASACALAGAGSYAAKKIQEDRKNK